MSVTPPLPLSPGESRVLRGLHEQHALGAALAGALPAGSVLFLEGELGAGKTSLTQGLVGAHGFTEPVTSPTYALMNVYPTPGGPVLHVDAYRVRDVQELFEMDLEELVRGSRVSVIEWGEGLYAEYPDAPILRLEHQPDPETRLVTRLR
ncbi:tRNA (adenosine(37)-N6)-threonylcarbamoyltransferase complex ATPase subunit type 1 TsaE [Deinococcus daejeonensis]|uniref:tRNA threonylcarbamoyladenosine biosynthesis protein TsaE n=1 Tax=Deinococcus daejeonensis TaxID=1007098 RepID=A0ABQ2JBN0_9DEIO|nr:tRNA (adenosine(37)-N6)-threonylcarbamoyltransferase complex ATPase subunit type 1 TsaE [Deinococcus daejeonensis]GGN41709.1 tRNA (adenosine(37)-N6)-threonylcarbamoyltransferase complex ATPase subunit type 1 TsaE [Deinococcus daejeonensis]